LQTRQQRNHRLGIEPGGLVLIRSGEDAQKIPDRLRERRGIVAVVLTADRCIGVVPPSASTSTIVGVDVLGLGLVCCCGRGGRGLLLLDLV